jgi:hypothetical protein
MRTESPFDGSPPGPGESGGKKREEVPMFQMLDEEKPTAEQRKLFLVKIIAFVAAVAAMAGGLYLFILGYLK